MAAAGSNTEGSGGRLLLVGCGKMGAALLNGWIDGGYDPAEIRVVEPQESALQLVHSQPVPLFVADAGALDEGFDPAVVVFAVKPQIMNDAAPLSRIMDTMVRSPEIARTVAMISLKPLTGRPRSGSWSRNFGP